MQGEFDLEDQFSRDLIGLISKAGVAKIIFPPTMIKKVNEAKLRLQLMNNLKQIGLALHSYHDANNRFPPATNIPGKPFNQNDQPLLSWRVHILPYVEQEELHKQFRFDEPWDSKHNLKLLDKMPAVFKTSDDSTKTSLLAISGKGAAYEGKRGLTFNDIKDGTANTIYAVIAGPDKAVPWTKPEDLPFDPRQEAPFDPKVPNAFFGKLPDNSFLALFANGAVKQISTDKEAKFLRAMLTRDAGDQTKLKAVPEK